MSGCHCDDPRRFRVTGEVIDIPPSTDRHAIGTGSKQVRIRCVQCGGKVQYVGTDLLNALGIPDEEIRNGRCLSEDEQVSLEVDLV